MTKVLSPKRIEGLLTNAIKVSKMYLNSDIGNNFFVDCDIDDEDNCVSINIYEEYFSDYFYDSFYNDYYSSNYRKNSKNRKELHKHLFEKWYGILKYIEKQYEGFDIDFYVHHVKDGSSNHIYYQLSDIELMLEIDSDGEEEDFDMSSNYTYSFESKQAKMLIDKLKKYRNI